MRADELDYDLPPALIAQTPLADREASRLLVVDRSSGRRAHGSMRDLPTLVRPSLFVFNDTRVIPARLLGTKPSGGKFELLLIERLAGAAADARGRELWCAMGRPLKSLRPGQALQVGTLAIEVGERVSDTLLQVWLSAPEGVDQALEQVGRLPLPPYIARAGADEGTTALDRERYQTTFARTPGAVAAPTAGLHFGPALLDELKARGHRIAFVTLHVGPGTFAPLSVDTLAEHPMHEEHFELPSTTADAIALAKAEGRPVIAVGTTVVRTLESAASPDGSLRAGPGATRLCIYPPYTFRVIDGLVTNFHLPRSTLLALVMALAGADVVRAAYREAIEARYRFFSYGDAMLIRP
ncbi:MAG: tRNA preQ1(34) S-adenosylmethionine ribosyltransferase-isomerase QueA [Myxococcales bacterium]